MREYRLSYGSPCQADRRGKPGNVATRVDVAVRPVSTRTGEAMLHPFSDSPTHVAHLRRVRRVNKHHGQPSTLCLVSHKVLELAEGPPMQPRSDPLPCLDVGADVGQIFHSDSTRSGTDGFCNDGLTGFVVDMLHMPLLTTGDSAELAFSSPATVGLETTTMGKVDVPVVPEFSAAPDLAGTGRCEVVLADIDAKRPAARQWCGVWDVDGEVEVPNTLADDQLGFFGQATGEQVALMLTTDERNLDAPVEGEQRERITLDRVGTFVEVNRRRIESNGRNRFVLDDTFVGLERLVSISYTVNGLAHHLAAQRRKLFAHHVIGQVVQRHSVPAAMLDSKRNDGVASLSEGIRKGGQRRRLLWRCSQLERYRSYRHIGYDMRYSAESQESQPTGCPLSLPMPKGRGISRRIR